MPTCSPLDSIAHGAEGAMHMDLNIIRSAVTVILFLLFILLCVSVWSRRRRAEFEAAARLPFEENELPEPKNSGEEP